MKVLRIYLRLPPKKGGMEKHIYRLSLYQNIEHKVVLFYNQGNPISDRDIKILPKLRLDKIQPNFIGVSIFYIALLFRLFVIKREKFDIIHIHGDWSSIIFCKLLKKVTKARIIIFSFHDKIYKSSMQKVILPLTLPKIDLIFSTGYEAANVLRGFSNKDIVVQHSGVEEVFYLESLEKVESKKKFKAVTVANLVAKKNIKLILQIAEKLPEVDFVIVGKGPEEPNLLNIIHQKNINNVALLGYKTPEEIRNLYKQSDCYLLTSFAEGTPTSALEAMACGLPIITSNAGGIEHIVETEINGFVAYDYKPETYINYIKTLINSPKLCKTISANNRDIAKDFRWSKIAENITKKTIDCYNKK